MGFIMSTIRCSSCNAQGQNSIQTRSIKTPQTGGYGLIYCGACGAIYGVIAMAQVPHVPATQHGVEPRCPSCSARGLGAIQAQMLQSKVVGSYGLLACKQCGAIHGPVSVIVKKDVSLKSDDRQKIGHQTVKESSPKRVNTKIEKIWELLGHADLTGKLPYSPDQIAKRMQATGRGVNTNFMRIVMDDGPPVCLKCKIDMVQSEIPHGYGPNQGKTFWVCPSFLKCNQWELAEPNKQKKQLA